MHDHRQRQVRAQRLRVIEGDNCELSAGRSSDGAGTHQPSTQLTRCCDCEGRPASGKSDGVRVGSRTAARDDAHLPSAIRQPGPGACVFPLFHTYAASPPRVHSCRAARRQHGGPLSGRARGRNLYVAHAGGSQRIGEAPSPVYIFFRERIEGSGRRRARGWEEVAGEGW